MYLFIQTQKIIVHSSEFYKDIYLRFILSRIFNMVLTYVNGTSNFGRFKINFKALVEIFRILNVENLMVKVNQKRFNNKFARDKIVSEQQYKFDFEYKVLLYKNILDFSYFSTFLLFPLKRKVSAFMIFFRDLFQGFTLI